jgi:L-rhamnose mutarotase
MKRRAFKMKLKPGFEEEYKKRHDKIWPELAKLLSKAGIRDYSIFLDELTLTLFAVQKLNDNNKAGDVRNDPVVRKWWDYMADIMDVNLDNSPVEVGLKEVFHLD